MYTAKSRYVSIERDCESWCPELSMLLGRDGPNLHARLTRLVGLYIRAGLPVCAHNMTHHRPEEDSRILACAATKLLVSLRAHMDSLPGLCVVVLEIGSPPWMDKVDELDPSIRDPLSLTRNITYRWCRTDGWARPPITGTSAGHWHPHIFVDPTTLQATGMFIVLTVSFVIECSPQAKNVALARYYRILLGYITRTSDCSCYGNWESTSIIRCAAFFTSRTVITTMITLDVSLPHSICTTVRLFMHRRETIINSPLCRRTFAGPPFRLTFTSQTDLHTPVTVSNQCKALRV